MRCATWLAEHCQLGGQVVTPYGNFFVTPSLRLSLSHSVFLFLHSCDSWQGPALVSLYRPLKTCAVSDLADTGKMVHTHKHNTYTHHLDACAGSSDILMHLEQSTCVRPYISSAWLKNAVIVYDPDDKQFPSKCKKRNLFFFTVLQLKNGHLAHNCFLFFVFLIRTPNFTGP